MIFNEIYGCYYDAIAKILSVAVTKNISKNEMREIIENNAFTESFFEIEDKLRAQEYQLLNKDGSTPIKNKPTLPLTELQKRWLKTISLDKRIKLFCDDFPDFSDTSPIYLPEDYHIYDMYRDGDDYESEQYIKNFRTILLAIKEKKPLKIAMMSRNNRCINTVAMPKRIEYSPKDDKFRLYTKGSRQLSLVNVGKIGSCEIYDKEINLNYEQPIELTKTVTIELYDSRNTLERFMYHFAHFKKVATKIENKKYKIDIYYEAIDETELIIRILSFGQFVKVISPDSFMRQIRYRINKQKLLFKQNQGL